MAGNLGGGRVLARQPTERRIDVEHQARVGSQRGGLPVKRQRLRAPAAALPGLALAGCRSTRIRLHRHETRPGRSRCGRQTTPRPAGDTPRGPAAVASSECQARSLASRLSSSKTIGKKPPGALGRLEEGFDSLRIDRHWRASSRRFPELSVRSAFHARKNSGGLGHQASYRAGRGSGPAPQALLQQAQQVVSVQPQLRIRRAGGSGHPLRKTTSVNRASADRAVFCIASSRAPPRQREGLSELPSGAGFSYLPMREGLAELRSRPMARQSPAASRRRSPTAATKASASVSSWSFNALVGLAGGIVTVGEAVHVPGAGVSARPCRFSASRCYERRRRARAAWSIQSMTARCGVAWTDLQQMPSVICIRTTASGSPVGFPSRRW